MSLIQSATTYRRVAIFVEPSPFTHVSGMRNRFQCLIKGLRDLGDDVTVVTPDTNPPKHFHGAQVGTKGGKVWAGRGHRGHIGAGLPRGSLMLVSLSFFDREL